MRILLLTYELPPVGGGGGRIAQDIAEKLAQRGHEIVIITSHLRGLPKEEYLDGGIKVIRVPSLRREAFRAGFLTMGAYIFSGFWDGLRLINIWRPEAIHVHFAVPTGVLAWALSRLKNIPYLLTAHLGDVPGGAPEKTGKWFRWVFPFTKPIWQDASKVVAVSEFTRQLALKHYPVEIDVIHNGIDIKENDPGEIKLQSPPRITFAGRLMKQKNPLEIIKTLARLKDLPWDCVLLGDGPLREDVENEIAHHNLQDRFILPGWITPEEVIENFGKSDILFMPSLSEGLPVVGVQALAMGLAMVVSNIGGFMDLVKEGENGFLIDNRDDYEKHLRYLLTNPEKLRSYREASRTHAEVFSLEEIVSEYESCLEGFL
ncbi:MAG: glycosyltransferase family 4 protein [Anaerolineae bacterium]|mgnify:CR=1 FL=1|jgi:glycosyltransferase involved in cell wall biosynthesis|nr:glycosyltransferase family 4 protein [Anaerolineae bacterium]MBT3714068.1 glycosyltransferase family 4 protein [Anaerolineae bacterium]MBT4310082.1 glycosyltransferase family 4 protein [Anaerolineae bacterium]MBT4457621.1 glycosyltransferase family 4 protein [Anaerolineae bacterium]MBT4841116.1 glycosyltransferase family 4 protein [Anaerolineae bacterium]